MRAALPLTLTLSLLGEREDLRRIFFGL